MNLASKTGADFEAQGLKLDYVKSAESDEPYGFTMMVSLEDLAIQIRLLATFGDDNVCLRCDGIGRVPETKVAEVYRFLNEMNRYYRWAQVYAESDGRLVLQADQYVNEETCIEQTRKMLATLFRISADLYPRLMKELWSEKE